MEKHEYKTLYEFEDSYWWYLGLQHTIRKLLSTYIGLDKIRHFKILDAGCGTGGNLNILKKFGEGVGLDFSRDALLYCKKRDLKYLCRASVENFPFKSGSFDLILCMDVLCHKTVKSKLDVINKMKDLLKPGGYLLLNLPAFDSLKSEHDRAVHTDKRFSMKETKEKLKTADLDINRIIYFNTLLFPFISLSRFFRKSKTSEEIAHTSDFKKIPEILNKSLLTLLKFEASYIKNFNLPFGLSIMALAQKKG